MGLAQRVDGIAAEVGDGFAHHLVGGAGVELHVAGQRERVGAALLQRLADVERLDPGKLVDAGGDQFAEFRQEPPAFGRGQAPPFALKRALGRLDRRVDVGRRPARDLADLGPARRVLDREPRARRGSDPAPADETFVGRKPSRLGGCGNSLKHRVCPG
jgi:hypothetical protein